MTEHVYDHIVCGAGTAGCLLANRLSADPSRRVLLVEAGGADDWLWIHIPVGYLRCIGNPRTDWLFRTEPDPGLHGRALRYPRGKVLGGCSSINGMIYMRGQARDYDHWAHLGNPGWSWSDCLPFFLAHEDFYRGADALHGAGGEWRVERQRLRWDILDAFALAAQQAGIPHTEDFNRGDNEGVGYFHVNQRRGVRWNAARAFLRPALGRPNLDVWTGAHLTRVRLAPGDDGRWRTTGVSLRRGAEGPPLDVDARHGVVLCTGAVGTPQLLQLSGIGAPDHLRDVGIAPLHALPGVGENLQDHLQLRAVFGVSGATTLNTLSRSWLGRASIGWQYAWRRGGPLSMAPSQLGAFTRSRPELPHADLEYHVQPLSLDAFGEPLHTHDAFTASVCHLNPTSRGRVLARGPDPMAPPAIHTRYLSTDEDRRVAADALRLTRRIVAQPALARHQPRELRPGPEHVTDEALSRLAGEIGTTIFHPAGTAKMGPAHDPAAVVDARLQVHGVQGLHVADTSVMPTITSGNTSAPTLMIAERAAAWLRGEGGRR